MAKKHIFLDLKKVCDTIHHKMLIKKLNKYSIKIEASDWFSSYLSNRQHWAEISGTNSSWKHNVYGVPQGAVLGALLFLIYMNDLPSACKNTEMFLFAEDTNLIALECIASEVQKVLRYVIDFRSALLCINIRDRVYN